MGSMFNGMVTDLIGFRGRYIDHLAIEAVYDHVWTTHGSETGVGNERLKCGTFVCFIVARLEMSILRKANSEPWFPILG